VLLLFDSIYHSNNDENNSNNNDINNNGDNCLRTTTTRTIQTTREQMKITIKENVVMMSWQPRIPIHMTNTTCPDENEERREIQHEENEANQ
jgi:hypothetical protein